MKRRYGLTQIEGDNIRPASLTPRTREAGRLVQIIGRGRPIGHPSVSSRESKHAA